MPPPAVCVLAIVSTVGAAIAFKHFVYDPHFSHVVRRWLVQWRRGPHRDDDEPEVPMQETERSSGRETLGTSSPDGLLSRSRLRNMLQEENLPLSSIELDNLVAYELHEWRNEIATSSGQDLRQRNVANSVSGQGSYHDDGGHSHPLEFEEDTRPLPYIPLSPRITHVVGNSGSASPATPAFNVLKPLPSPPPTSTTEVVPSLPSPPNTATASPLMGSPSLSGSITGSQDPLMRRSLMQSQPGEFQVSSNLDRKPGTPGSPPPVTTPSHHSQLPLPLSPALLPCRISSPARSREQEQNSPFLLHVPSLSQSYPQELEIEYGLEFLSAPSSRSDSPFSMASISPRPPPATHQFPDRDANRIPHHRHTASPLLIGGGPPSEVFSPAVSLGMDLGNESFDALSPAVGPRQLELRAAATHNAAGGPGLGMYCPSSAASGLADTPPFFNGAAAGGQLRDPSITPPSVTNSLKSSKYLSFSESESGSGNEDDDDVPLAARRASLVFAMSGHSNSPRGTASEGRGHGQGLGLTLYSSPGDPPAPLSPSMLSPRSRLAEVSTSGYDARHGPLSDTSELSDLDLVSDYSAPSDLGELVSYPGSVNGSESGRGNLEGSRLDSPLRTATTTPHSGRVTNESDRESDASWSIAGGSDFGDDEAYRDHEPQTPQLRPVRKNGELRRDDTIRGRKNL